jgi:hypothetical protein
MPPSKFDVCVPPRLLRAVVTLTVPRRVSSSDPTGIWRAWLSGTKVKPRTCDERAPALLALAFGIPTSTVPRTGSTFAERANAGRGLPKFHATSNVRVPPGASPAE